jgi:hypothetical protein
MKIGFYAEGEGAHLEIARHLIDSAHEVMPDVEVFQLTDGVTREIEGCTAIRIPERMPMGVRRLTHYSRLPGEWCFVDSDVVFRKDVREVFDRPFDWAIASRVGTYMENSEYGRLYPFNFGVVFSKTPEVWKMLVGMLLDMPREKQHWGGEQELVNGLAHIGGEGSAYGLEVLPARYNFTPKKQTDDLSDVAILHLKGPRKAWITTLAKAA